jgi:hypothetical protein
LGVAVLRQRALWPDVPKVPSMKPTRLPGSKHTLRLKNAEMSVSFLNMS